MLIHLQPNKSAIRNRINYLLNGTERQPREKDKVEVIYGDVSRFILIHSNHRREVKSFNLLVTFKETKEELEKKLHEKGKNIRDLHDEILEYLVPYPLEKLNILSIVHTDTDHYHWHITIDNQHLSSGKALYLPKTKLEIRFYERLRRYISAKYGISLGVQQPYSVEVGTKKLIEKLKEKGKEGTTLKREEVKRLITEQIMALIISGDINSRKDIEDYIEKVLELPINRRGKTYISIRYGKTKIRLSGGIYDESGFRQLAEEIKEGATRDFFEPPERAGELERELRELIKKRQDLVRRRVQPTKKENGTGREPYRPETERYRERSTERYREPDKAKERRLDSYYQGADNGAERRTFINEDNQTSNSTNHEGLEIHSFSDIPDRSDIGSDSRLETGEGSREGILPKKSGRAGEKLPGEVSRTERDREPIRANKTRMGEKVEDRDHSRRAGKFSLPYFPNSFGKDSWKRDLDFNARRDERQRDYFTKTSRKILHSIRPSPSTAHTSRVKKQYYEAVMDWQQKRQEELEAIKQLHPDVIFADLGIETKKVGHRLNIYAPWREEKEPSVFIEQKGSHWVWKDFGTGRGGTWIDFFMELYGWDYVETVRYLRERYLGIDIELKKEIEQKRNFEEAFSFEGRKYELLKLEAKPVSHPTLKKYLEERGIRKIPEWLKEVHYWTRDKETGEIKKYFALGVKTITGSWILRSALKDGKKAKFNLRTSDKQEHSFAYLQNRSKRLIIVEGLFDALSIHQIARRGDFDLIIMSGTSQTKKLLRSEILKRYEEIIIATDFDESGREVETDILLYLVREKLPVKLKRIEGGEKDKDINEAYLNNSLKILDLTEKLLRLIEIRRKQEKEQERKQNIQRYISWDRGDDDSSPSPGF